MSLALERVGLGDERWLRFLATQRDATIFHRPEWATGLAEAYGFRAFAVLAFDGDDAVAGAPFLRVGGPFRRRWSSLPFTDHCAPLGDRAHVAAFVSDLAGIAASHGVASVELRDEIGAGGEIATAGVRHVLAVLDERSTIGRIASAHQRNARRAEREGVTVAFGRSAGEMSDFYELHVRTRRRLGVPVQPRRFFDLLYRLVIAQGDGFLATARHDGRAIASAVFLRSGRTLIYKYGASDERRWALRPNDLLFRDTIALACREGYAAMDFGRSDLEDTGLRRFKSELGGVEIPLRYTRVGPWPDARRAGKLLASIIRHSSPIVCRALGQALYRYSA